MSMASRFKRGAMLIISILVVALSLYELMFRFVIKESDSYKLAVNSINEYYAGDLQTMDLDRFGFRFQ